jgi:hypothetical protein
VAVVDDPGAYRLVVALPQGGQSVGVQGALAADLGRWVDDQGNAVLAVNFPYVLPGAEGEYEAGIGGEDVRG